MSGFGVDFGQKVDLTASIRNILRNYPEGTAVLKELVQNADDAGASTVVFYLDHRTHSSSKLADQALASFQGPSLLVYNNAIFTAEDFQSIQRIGDSLKKSSEDSRAKIGRFGIGFNAVYHWTDLPSFVSSNYLVMLDPQARFLPNVNPSNPGKMVDFVGNPTIVSQFPDQFKPYEIEGLKWGKTFNGTLFRLPLRTADQAKTSLLSKRALSLKEAADLLEALKLEASAMLLFLKSVTKIEIRELRDTPAGVAAGAGTLLFSCQATNSSPELLRKRCLVSDKPQLALAASNVDFAMPADYTLTIECTAGASLPSSPSSPAPSTAAAPTVYTEHWEVCNQLGGRGANQIASHPDNALLRLIPWAGVAACVRVLNADGTVHADPREQERSASPSAGTGDASHVMAARDGLAYCFLPLPVRTGLPVMVNGFFELSSNRRDVWQAGADMTGDGRTRALWNIALMKELIAPSYARLLVRLRDALGYSAQYQRLWPNIRTTSAPWDEVVKSTLHLSRHTKLLKIATAADVVITSPPSSPPSSPGRPAAAKVAVSSVMKTGTTSTAAGAFSEAGWISCEEAVLLPPGFNLEARDPAPSRKKTTNLNAHAQEEALELAAYLVRAQAPLVLCSEALKTTLLETNTCTYTASPSYTRRTLRGTGAGSTGGGVGSAAKTAKPAAPAVPTVEMCKFLLKYCFSDLTFGSGAALSPVTAQALDGLPLLPMSDNTVSALRIFSAAQLTAITEVNSMGFSLSQSVCALNLAQFNTAAACDLLATEPGRIHAAMADHANSIHLLLDGPQLEVFHKAAPVLLNKHHIAPNEIDILSHAAVAKCSNVRTFHPQFVPDLLRFILPGPCFEGPCTTRAALGDAVFDAAVAFLKVFWQYASTRPEVVSAVKEGASVVPTKGLQALFPLSRLSNLLVQTKADVSLQDPLVEVLQLLGVQFVDPAILPEKATMPGVFWEYVLSPTRSGVLLAIDSAQRTTAVAAGVGGKSSGGDPFARLSAAQRDLLRQYVATVEALRSLTEKECAVLRGLPIYLTAQSSGTCEPRYVAIGDRYTRPSGGGPTSSSARAYVTVADFHHLPDAILPEHFLKHTATHDLHLLTQLQVTVLSRAQYFRTEFLPHVQALYTAHPVETMATILQLLDEVKSLSDTDKTFLSLLGTMSFIPCASSQPQGNPGSAGKTSAPAGRRLCKASELFDPTDAELRTLLDPQCFPDTELMPVLQRPELLALLKRIGLQTSLNWPAIVACARSVADMSDSVPEAPTAPVAAGGESGSPSPASAAPLVENTAKASRARSLLRFLDKNITRLTHEEREKPALERRSSATPASLFSSFGSFFGGGGGSGGTSPARRPSGTEKKGAPSLEVEPTTQSMETCMQELKFIAWVPVMTTATHECMPWPQAPTKTGHLSITAAPLDTVPVTDAWLVSATKRLVDEPVHSPALQRLLCWDEPAAVQVIAIQLRELSKRYLSLYPSATAEDTTDGAMAVTEATAAKRREQQRLREIITGLIPQLYQRLNKAVSPDAAPSGCNPSAAVQSILSILETSAWIWVGDAFVTIDKVALNAGVNAAPYLYQLPQDLQVYTALLHAFQIKARFNNRDYIESLRQMAVDTGAVTTTTTATAAGTASAVQPTIKERPLSEARLDVCISLATLLATESSASSSLHTASQAIYLPDNQGKLALSDALINDDVPWLSGPEYISVRAGCRLIHPNISSKVATTLGVKSLRLALLNKSLDQNIFALPAEATVESFGQAESLTNRLKTILDMYPDGNPIFSELIQNADDAGATVVNILLDENLYQCESLLDSKMSALQGPSLVVRNDAMFTEADFKSLAKIGQGSKLDKLATTGRFGLGFNSTYHLTDTPSFVSGDHIVIFDPHCSYVPGATTNQPGVRIRFAGSDLSATFRNQFEPFEFFGCDVRSKFPGTLFRFPLRTASQARKSEISKRSYTVADMEQNLAQLAGQLPNMLIFLRNVLRIEILRCEAGSATPVLLHSADARVSNVECVNDQSLLKYFDRGDGSNSAATLSRDGFYKRLLAAPDNALPRVFSQVHINADTYATAQAAPVSPAPAAVEDAAAVQGGAGAATSALTVSTGPAAVSTVVHHTEVEYMVSAGLCGGEAKRMACLESLRHFKLVPMGAVAACINRSTDAAVTEADAQYPQLQGVAFCYLPLPVLTQLPVHCNAYFELSSNRRDIWKGDDTKGEAKMRSDWNICIMKDVLAPLYASLLMKMHDRAQHAARDTNSASPHSMQVVLSKQQRLHYQLLSLFPYPLPHDPWNNVVTGLFEHLQNERLLYSELGGGSFVSLKQAYLLQRNSVADADPAGDKLEALLLQENLAVVRAPEALLKTLASCRAVAGEVNPALVRGLFHVSKAHTHPTLGVTLKPPKAALEHVLSAAELECAVFWLQYCMRDITVPAGGPVTSAALEQLQQLLQLHLLPLENNTLGTLQPATDALPYYLVNDTERRLLSRAGSHIVASETVLGQHVYNVLSQEVFAQVCNVRKITTIDTLKLITTILPGNWMVASTVYANRVAPPPATTATTVVSKPKGLASVAVGVAESTTTDNLIVSNEWLVSLWIYIVENKCMDMFREMFPIVPVVYPNTLPEGQYLVKVSAQVPVLHMTYREIGADAVGLLAQLGVFVFDPAVLGGKSYSGDIVELLSAPNARGILDALTLRVQALQRSNTNLDALLSKSLPARLALQGFLLDSVVSKIDILTGGDIGILCALPVWATFPAQAATGSTQSPASFAALDLETMQLPPSSSDASEQSFLFDATFLRLRSERDRSLYLKLGVREPTMGQLYAAHTVPRFQSGAIPDDKMDGLVVSMLTNLPQLEKENLGLTELLSSCAIVRCDGDSVQLCAPSALYDPDVPLLRAFLPPHLFPSSALYRDPALMQSLRLLGLRTKASPEAVLIGAKAVHAEHERFVQRNSPSETHDAITGRAVSLMTYLETHIDKILLEVSPATVQAFDRQQDVAQEQSLRTPQDAESAQPVTPPPTPQPSPQGGPWGAQLRSIAWVPVFVHPPSRVVHADLALPWPAKVHAAPIAAPSQTTSSGNIWLCSSSQRICSVDISKTSLLEHVLGWDKAIPGRSIAGQLLALRQTHDTAATRISFTPHSANEVYRTVVPLLLQPLKEAFKRESPAETKLWIDALRGKAIVWMQSRFIETTRLAFTPLPGVDTEPFLFIVPPELRRFKRLLLALGARESFEAADLAALTRDLYAQSNGAPLSSYKITLCIGIVNLLHKLVSGEDISSADDPAVMTTEEDGVELPVATLVSEESAAAPTSTASSAAGGERSPAGATESVSKTKKVSLAELGTLYLPDELHSLQPADTLTFDDAPWMSAALHQQAPAQGSAASTAAPSNGIRFVHGHVTIATAAALGCRSLRGQLFAGEDVHCPDAESLRYALDQDGLRDTMIDLLYVADACGASKLHFHYDGRTHPQESLLHPGLAETQGPALMVYLEGSSPIDREVMSLLLSVQNLNNDMLQRVEPTSPVSPGSSTSAAGASARARFRRATGKKLLSTFAVTDCLQVLSGNEFFVFDPCGKNLVSSAATSTAGGTGSAAPTPERGIKRLLSKQERRASRMSTTETEPAQPRAQHYLINKPTRSGAGSGTGDSSALERFPDQFAPFFQLPYQFKDQLQRSGRVNGVVLRLPLRRTPSAISRSTATLDEVKVHFGGLRAIAGAALVFAEGLSEVTASHFSFAEVDAATSAGAQAGAKADAPTAAASSAAVASEVGPHLDLSVKLVSPIATRRSRHSITADKGWTKQGFSKLFFKAFVPPEVMYTLALDTTLRCRDVWLVPTPQLVSLMTLMLSKSDTATSDSVSRDCLLTHREDWLVAAISGYGKLRDLALTEPYSTMELQPFVTAAVPILDSALLMDITVPPDAGMYYHSSAAVGTTGLPFHMEGSFLQIHDQPALPKGNAVAMKGVRFGEETGGSGATSASTAGDISVCQHWTEALMFVAIDTLYPKLLFEVKARIESVAKQLAPTSVAAATATGPVPTAAPSGASAVTTTGGSAGLAARKLRLLSGFYKYFPYSPRTSSVALKVLNTTAVWSNFAQNPVFLQQGGFHYLHESMLPAKLLPSEVLAYILPILPLAFCPQQLTADLTTARVGVVASLSPAKLRHTMAHNALLHCSRLTNNSRLVRALLEYVVQDILEKSVGEGEHTKRRLYRELAGVPLMCVANMNVKTFPRNASEQVAIAPAILHALLPGLKNAFLHPTLMADLPLFADALFLETLFITAFNASFLERHIGSVLPVSYRLVPAVEWVDSAAAATVGSAARAVRDGTNNTEAQSGPSPLLLYTIWNNVLCGEASWTEIERLRDYPLVPVVSRGRRLLLSMNLLSTVFSAESTEAQDEQRMHLKREAGRMTSLATSAVDGADLTTTAMVDEWAWTAQPLATGHTKPRSIHRPRMPGAAAGSHGRTGGHGVDSDDDLGDDIITDLDFPGTPLPVADPPTAMAVGVDGAGPVPVPATAAGSPANVGNETVAPNPPVQTPARPTGSGAAGSPSASSGVLRILRALGVPFLDTAIMEDVPLIINRGAGGVGAQVTDSGGATDFSGRRILQCLHRLDSNHITITPRSSTAQATGQGPDGATASTAVAPQPLLAYDDLTVSDRTTLLLLMSNQQHQAMAPLSSQEQEQLKQLRLFTSKADGTAVAIADCRAGVYWCREESVLHTVRNRAASIGGQGGLVQEMPVILIYDAALRDLYTLLGVEELTAATAVRKFIVPQLRTLEPLPRLRVMIGLAEQWDSYRSDQQLVDQLKEVPFVPVQNNRRTTTTSTTAYLENLEGCQDMDPANLCLASEVFLWTNEELLTALRGSRQGCYFPPVYLRTPAMRAMCEDLGMQKELTEASFKRIATDIEAALHDAYTGNTDSAAQLDGLREAAERGRGLLRYAKAGDRLALLLQNKPYAQSIGRIRFVPVRVPTTTEAGGYVHYQEDVGRFDGLLARTHGALAFTGLPIIDEDIVPPQYFYSALGITSTPSADVVLRHVRNLTSQGESLDRWNAPYEVTKTFSAIFQYLQDNWKTLSPNVKASLSNINLVPVGNMLIKPTRLFFRLAEDLSPFMHEIPRLYGAHEAFLKQIGIKETPSVQDYVRFLSDLAAECGDCFLNPNELRAVVAILQVIAAQSTESAEASALTTPSLAGIVDHDSPQGKATTLELKRAAGVVTDLSALYVPDERSVMRPISQCLLNDNEWYRGSVAVQGQLRHSGLYMLHPSISASIASQLQVERLSSVVAEELVTSAENDSVDSVTASLQGRYQAAMTNPTFVSTLSTLLLNKQATEGTADSAASVAVSQRTPSALAAQLQVVRVRLVHSLRTQFRLAYGNVTAVTNSDGDSSQERLSYLQQSPASGATLFVNLALARPPLSASLAVAAGLCQLLSVDLSLSYAIAALLDASEEAHTQLVLESLHVHQGGSSTESEEVGTSSHHTRGVPGELVSPQDALLLELRPLRAFRVGEIVAYEEHTAAPSVAASTTEGYDATLPVSGVKAGASDTPDPAPSGTETPAAKAMVYAKIISVGAAADEGLRRITIKTGTGVRSVLSTDVFTFKSARECNTAKAASASAALKTPTKPSLFSFGAKKPSAAPATATSAATRAAAPSPGAVSVASTESAEVSRVELIGAVNGLLARAGVPMDLEQQGMVEHILDLEGNKKRLEKELAAERQQLLQCKEQLEGSANRLKCPICLTNDVYFVLVPCGHTICESCIEMWRGNSCPTCRTRMQTKVRFFLPGSGDA